MRGIYVISSHSLPGPSVVSGPHTVTCVTRCWPFVRSRISPPSCRALALQISLLRRSLVALPHCTQHVSPHCYPLYPRSSRYGDRLASDLPRERWPGGRRYPDQSSPECLASAHGRGTCRLLY